MEMREPLTTETDAHNEINAARSLMTPGSCQVVMWPRARASRTASTGALAGHLRVRPRKEGGKIEAKRSCRAAAIVPSACVREPRPRPTGDSLFSDSRRPAGGRRLCLSHPFSWYGDTSGLFCSHHHSGSLVLQNAERVGTDVTYPCCSTNRGHLQRFQRLCRCTAPCRPRNVLDALERLASAHTKKHAATIR